MALERLDPKEYRGKYVVDRYARYSFAAQFVAGRRVLDLACGPGYGSHLLLRAGAREVVGVDVAEEAVDVARQHYSAPGITFLLGDAHQLGPEVQAPFDLIVSFETIEHLNDPARWIRRARELSHDETILVFSVPNEADNPPGNPYHLHYYDHDSFDALLAEEFPHRLILPYYTVLSNVIGCFSGDAQGPLRVGSIKAAEVPADDLRPDGYVAVCRLMPGSLQPRELLTYSRRSYLDTDQDRQWLENQRAAWMRTAEQAEEQKAAWRKVAEERDQTLAELERINQWHEQTERNLEENIRRLEATVGALKQPYRDLPDSGSALGAEVLHHRRQLALVQASPGFALLERMKSILPAESRLGRMVRRAARKLARP